MKELLHQVAKTRMAIETQRASIAHAEVLVAEITEAKWLAIYQEGLRELHDRLVKEEATIRVAALDHYTATGETRPTRGVQIKLYGTVAYDPAYALDYAKREAPMFLSLDTKSWERAVKAMPAPPDFVTIGQEPRVTLATDLSEYLED